MQKRKRTTVAMFHNAVLQCLMENDLDKLNVRAVCNKAGLNRSTFYLHYQDINQLLQEMEDELIEQCSFAVSNEKDDVLSYLQYIQNNKNICKILLTSAAFDSFKKRFMRQINELVCANIHYDINPAMKPYVYAFIVEGTNAIITRWVENDCSLSINIVLKLCRMLPMNAINGTFDLRLEISEE